MSFAGCYFVRDGCTRIELSRIGAHAWRRRLLCGRRKGQELHCEREREDEMKRAISVFETARRTYDESTRHSLSRRFIRRHRPRSLFPTRRVVLFKSIVRGFLRNHYVVYV